MEGLAGRPFNGRALAIAALAGLILLASCAVREPRPEGAWQQEREQWFENHPQWSVQGRLGLSDGERGGSLSMTWKADGERHSIALRTIAGGRQWRLWFNPVQAQLTGTDVGRLVGPDPDALVEQAVGWPIPVRWMSHWLRGLPAPDTARVAYAPDGAMRELSWRDWRIEFSRWSESAEAGVLLPARLEARSPPYRVRVALGNWTFASPAAPMEDDESL